MINLLWFWWHMHGIDCRGWFGKRVPDRRSHYTLWED
jgi:hypothetical protein